MKDPGAHSKPPGRKTSKHETNRSKTDRLGGMTKPLKKKICRRKAADMQGVLSPPVAPAGFATRAWLVGLCHLNSHTIDISCLPRGFYLDPPLCPCCWDQDLIVSALLYATVGQLSQETMFSPPSILSSTSRIALPFPTPFQWPSCSIHGRSNTTPTGLSGVTLTCKPCLAHTEQPEGGGRVELSWDAEFYDAIAAMRADESTWELLSRLLAAWEPQKVHALVRRWPGRILGAMLGDWGAAALARLLRGRKAAVVLRCCESWPPKKIGRVLAR